MFLTTSLGSVCHFLKCHRPGNQCKLNRFSVYAHATRKPSTSLIFCPHDSRTDKKNISTDNINIYNNNSHNITERYMVLDITRHIVATAAKHQECLKTPESKHCVCLSISVYVCFSIRMEFLYEVCMPCSPRACVSPLGTLASSHSSKPC